jgi:hypothetical protein
MGMASTPSGLGYDLFASNGTVSSFGDALYEGGMSSLSSPVVGGSVSASGEGYWLFAADGGVYSFGDAQFDGSLGGRALNAPIVDGTGA